MKKNIGIIYNNNNRVTQELKNKIQQSEGYLTQEENRDIDFRVIKEWQVSKLWFFQYNNKNIIGEIKHIKFPFLRLINLIHNRIESIEGIHKMCLPELETLRLGINNIITIQDIVKHNWYRLTEISIFGNKMKEIKNIQKVLSKKLGYIYVQNVMLNIQIQDIRCFCKLESSQIVIFKTSPVERISHSKHKSIIKKKYKAIKQMLSYDEIRERNG